MESATILSIFITSLLLSITGYSVYTAFGPVSKELRDPFEEMKTNKIKKSFVLSNDFFIYFLY
jgi:PsbN protein